MLPVYFYFVSQQVPEGTTMRSGSRLMVVEEELVVVVEILKVPMRLGDVLSIDF